MYPGNYPIETQPFEHTNTGWLVLWNEHTVQSGSNLCSPALSYVSQGRKVTFSSLKDLICNPKGLLCGPAIKYLKYLATCLAWNRGWLVRKQPLWQFFLSCLQHFHIELVSTLCPSSLLQLPRRRGQKHSDVLPWFLIAELCTRNSLEICSVNLSM